MNFHSLLVLFYCVVFAGCAHSDSVATTRDGLFASLRGPETSEVLAYFQRIKTLSIEVLTAEHAAATQTLARQKSDAIRLKLALLLLLPNTPFKDEGRAAALAEEALNNKAADMKNLALLVVAVATEQKRQEERLQQLTLKLKEEEKRTDAAQQKLDALKSIEKDLINREQTKPLKVK